MSAQDNHCRHRLAETDELPGETDQCLDVVSRENTIIPGGPLQQNPIFGSRQSGILCANYIHERVPALMILRLRFSSARNEITQAASFAPEAGAGFRTAENEA